MAFLSKVGNILKQTASRQINGDLSSAKPFIYQASRFMSSSKLFVGGLSYGTDQQGLTEAFSKYGEVIEARVIMDRETGRSRGFGFVTYVSTEEASSAIQALDGQVTDLFAVRQMILPVEAYTGRVGVGRTISKGTLHSLDIEDRQDFVIRCRTYSNSKISDGESDLHGRTVRVNYATDRQPRFQSSYGGGGGYGGEGYGYGGGNESGGYSGGGGGSGGYSGGGGYGGGGNYNSPGSSEGGGSAGGYGVDTGYGSSSNSRFGGNYNSVAGGTGGGDNFTGGSNFSGSGLDGGSGMGFGTGEQQFDHGAGGNLNHTAGKDDSLDGSYKDDNDEPANYAKRT